MSHSHNNVTICANCGRPKAPMMTTQQAPHGKWPTYWADLAHVAKRVLGENVATDEPVYVNGHRMGVPPIPAFLPPKEKLTVNPAPPAKAEPKPVYVNGRRMGVPPLTPLVLPKQ